jgi:succinoglycan biosynthesis transport protein ExoP
MRDVEAPGMRGDAAHPLERYLQIDVTSILSWLRKGAAWIVLCALLGAALGVAFTIMAKPRYTVTTDILIDPAGLQIVPDDLFRQNDQQRDSVLLNLESKRQTLLSRSVLLKVVQDLNLERDPEFVPPPSWTSMLSPRAWLGGSGGTQVSPELIALDNLIWRVSARRDELSLVITMAVWTNNAEKSILISEAILTAFRDGLVTGDSDGARRAADAMTDRLAELKAEVTAAERAVEVFRRENGLQSAQGELVRSRSMSQINQQLVEARQRLIAAQSRYDDLTASDSPDAAAMQSTTISSLRTQYATLRSRLDADQQVYGPRHPRIVQGQIELRTLQAEIEQERARLIRAVQNELDQARSVVAALETDAANVSSEVFTDNDAQVRLRDLTRDAAARTAIYEAFLVRARQITERQTLDTTNIRVISPPMLPRSRSWPPSTTRMAAFGGIGGLVLGVLSVLAAGVWREVNGAAPRGPAPRSAPPANPEPVMRKREDEPAPPAPDLSKPAGTDASATLARRRAGSLLNLRSNSLLMQAGEHRS